MQKRKSKKMKKDETHAKKNRIYPNTNVQALGDLRQRRSKMNVKELNATWDNTGNNIESKN